MKILVTGATGMVGRHVISLLQKEKIAFVTSSLNQPNNMEKMNWVKCDLREKYSPSDLNNLFPGISAIFHLGAILPNLNIQDFSMFDVNVRCCLSFAEWAYEENLPFIYLSSSTIYEDPFKKNIQENDKVGYSELGGFYGYTKYSAEQLLSFYKKKGLKLSILRPSSIYGCGLPSNKMIAKFLHLAKNNETIHLLPPIDEAINLIHAFDVAKAMLKALESKAWGIYNIAYLHEYSIYEIAQICIKLTEKGKIQVSDGENNIESKCKFSLCIQKARQEFGFEPIVDLNAGIRAMLHHSYELE